MPDALLTGRGLQRTFGSGATAVSAVRGVDLTLERGERVVVMGPSGSGKTTLASMLGGLLRPTSGNVVLDGIDLYGRDERERAQIRLRRFGFIFQSFNLLSALTAQENVEVPMRLAGASPRAARIKAGDLLERLGLGERRAHRPRDLSGGEKQRVAIARALANDADIVFADEPTANLDSATGHQVAEILTELASAQAKAVMIVSHDQRLLDTGTRVISLEDGRLAEQQAGGKSELRRSLPSRP